MTPAAQAKAEQAALLPAAFAHIAQLPREVFPDLQRPIAPQPPGIDEATIRRAHLVTTIRGIHWWDREGRRRARDEAGVRTIAELSLLRAEYADRPRQWQSALDAHWNALGANDPDVVLATLAAAFEDNEAPAAAVGVAGDEVTLVVLVPRASVAVPERRAGTTPAGNLSLKKLTKRESCEVYAEVAAGHVLATVNECFAVARSARSARIVAVRPGTSLPFGRPRPEAIIAARVVRDRLSQLPWQTADASELLAGCSSELHVRHKGAAKELQALDPNDHPDVRSIVDLIDLEDP